MKTSELAGALLDCWVHKALNPAEKIYWYGSDGWGIRWHQMRKPFSTDWAHGGPIIEMEGIAVGKFYPPKDGPVPPGTGFFALTLDDGIRMDAATPLVTAMRTYVASKFGDTVPDLLSEGCNGQE